MAACRRGRYGSGIGRPLCLPAWRKRADDLAMHKKTEQSSSPIELDVEHVKRLLPHRAPFLMIDRLTVVIPGESAIGWKAVTITEPHFAGHFPQYAVMPGVLIVEAMAQTAGALVVHSLGLTD